MAIKNKKVSLKTTSSILAALLVAPLSANAGFLDNISGISNTISSIGDTARNLKLTKKEVDDLTQEVGFKGSNSETVAYNGSAIAEGSVLVGKLNQTHVYSRPDSSSSKAFTAGPSDIMVYMGSEKNGYYSIQSDKGAGWVAKPLVRAQ